MSIDNLKGMDSKLKKASELGIHVVDLSFLDAIKASTGESASSIITKKNIAPWDCHSVNIFLLVLYFLGLFKIVINLDREASWFGRVGCHEIFWKIEKLRLVGLFITFNF